MSGKSRFFLLALLLFVVDLSAQSWTYGLEGGIGMDEYKDEVFRSRATTEFESSRIPVFSAGGFLRYKKSQHWFFESGLALSRVHRKYRYAFDSDFTYGLARVVENRNSKAYTLTMPLSIGFEYSFLRINLGWRFSRILWRNESKSELSLSYYGEDKVEKGRLYVPGQRTTFSEPFLKCSAAIKPGLEVYGMFFRYRWNYSYEAIFGRWRFAVGALYTLGAFDLGGRAAEVKD